MSQGAAFLAANNSHSFKVRKIWFNDGFNFDVNLIIKNEDKSITSEDDDYYFKNITLFASKKRFGSKRVLNFSNKNNDILEINTISQEGIEKKYCQHSLSNITNFSTHKKYKDLGRPKIHLQFSLSSANVVDFELAEVHLNETEIYEAYEKVNKDEEKLEEDEKKEDEKEDDNDAPPSYSGISRKKVNKTRHNPI